jgi:hypothetical protein
VRVAVTKKSVYAVTDDEDQRAAIPEGWPNNSWIYGTVVGGSSKEGWRVSFDWFPPGKKIQFIKKRDRLCVLKKGQVEPRFDLEEYRAGEDAGEIDLANADPSKKTKKSAATRSTEEFEQLDSDVRCVSSNPLLLCLFADTCVMCTACIHILSCHLTNRLPQYLFYNHLHVGPKPRFSTTSTMTTSHP